jgi:hypothetical protein
MADVVKLTVNLPKDEVDALKRLAEKRHLTMTDVIRQAIGTEMFLDDAKEQGSTVLIEDKKKKSVQRLVLR